MTCSQCEGRGEFMAFVATATGCGGLQPVRCASCGGSGQLSAEDVSRIAEGRRRRDDRVARGLNLREEAARLGIKPVELSAIERGSKSASAQKE